MMLDFWSEVGPSLVAFVQHHAAGSRKDGPASLACLVIGLALWSSLYAADLLLNGFVSTVQGLVAGSLVAMGAGMPQIAPAYAHDSRRGGVQRRADAVEG